MWDEEIKITLHNIPVRTWFEDFMKSCQLLDCPIDGFEPDHSKLPDQFKDCKIVIR